MIGTGLFLSSGSALAQSGPLGCLLGFIAVGVCFEECSANKQITFSKMGSVTASIGVLFSVLTTYQPNLPY